MFKKKHALLSSLVAAAACSTHANEADNMLEETFVISKKTSYANNAVSDTMVDQQSAITSVLAVIDNVPGVLINEGDVFGSDDWSTTVSIRGFQLSLDEQQIGMTVDGVPNGNSNYGGGAKANRFIDTQNLATVEVSQGTADIASRSHEALGGTLNFITQDPEDDERMRFSISNGDYDAKKYYVRYDTGEIFGNTTAYISYSDSDVKAWIDESGESNRQHFALKTKSTFDALTVTGYMSYDDTHEDNYQRVSLAEFKQNNDWDRLTGDWLGVPYIDQLYRRGWSTLRENFLAYVKFEWELTDLNIQVTPYYHDNEGRGDWLPPYIVDVTNDGAGEGESELANPTQTVLGGANLGQIFFVNADNVALTPNAGCESSITFPYGGADAEYDANCYQAGAIPVGSYRHTHYEKERFGITADIDWTVNLDFGENLVRAGIWYEDYERGESRDWHKVIDSSTSYHFNQTPYWVQYDRSYPVKTTMFYIEDTLTMGDLSVRLGGKQWYVDVEREDKFVGSAGNFSTPSDSDLLVNAGLLWEATDGLEIFAGYAENFAAVKDVVLEAADTKEAIDNIKPETSENTDLGLRYANDYLKATLTYYSITFDNRLTFISPDSGGDIDYLEQNGGTFQNVGGIESDGIEASASWTINENFSLYVSYTQNDSVYLGTGDNRADDVLDIETGKTVFGSVEDMWVISADWQRDDYRAGFTNKHVGERWMDAANTNRIDAFDTADIYVAVNKDFSGEYLQGYELRFTVNNVFDEDYIGGVSGGWGGWIGGGRTAAISLTADF